MTGSALENAGWVALIAIVPLLVLMLTSFVKVSVVLSLLRNAIGATDAPSGLVVMGVSLVLTFFVMAPVAVEMVHAAGTPTQGMPTQGMPTQGMPTQGMPTQGMPTQGTPDVTQTAPLSAPRATATGTAPQPAGAEAPVPDADGVPPSGSAGSAAGAGAASAASAAVGAPLELEAALRQVVPAELHGELDAVARGSEPLRRFLGRHAAERDRATFVELAGEMGHAAAGDELWVLAPAFLTTELREAFAIAVLIFLPFLVIDLVVGLSLAALGLQATSPQVVSLPLKLLLFVAVDGWRLLLDSLVRGYV